jgi:preprotein translocase subunit SecG
MSTTGVKPNTGPKKVAGVSVTSKRITILVIVAAAIWFILVNTQRISIRLWVPHITAPLWLVLVITFAGGLITGLLLQRRNRGGNSTR